MNDFVSILKKTLPGFFQNPHRMVAFLLSIYWKQVVGDEIGAVTQPIKISSDGKLHLEAKDPLWAQQLHYYKIEIIQKIQDWMIKEEIPLIELKEIYLSAYPVGKEKMLPLDIPEPYIPPFQGSNPLHLLNEGEWKQICESVGFFKDSELKKSFEILQAKDMLTRRKKVEEP